MVPFLGVLEINLHSRVLEGSKRFEPAPPPLGNDGIVEALGIDCQNADLGIAITEFKGLGFWGLRALEGFGSSLGIWKQKLRGP